MGDRDGRAESVDGIDVGLGHLAEKLAGEAREAFDVAPLSFGEQGVESEGAFAGTADARQADQLIPGEHQIDVAEIMFPGALNDDVGSRHAGELGWTGEFRVHVASAAIQATTPNTGL